MSIRVRHTEDRDRAELCHLATALLADCGFPDRPATAAATVDRVLRAATVTRSCDEAASSRVEAQRLARGLLGQVETGEAFVALRDPERWPFPLNGPPVVRLAGFLGFVIVPHEIIGEWTAVSLGWYVRPEAPLRGFVASRLLRSAQDMAKALGATKLLVSSINSRLDHHLAKRTGYTRAEASYLCDL